jgi:hypothetical protein
LSLEVLRVVENPREIREGAACLHEAGASAELGVSLSDGKSG